MTKRMLTIAGGGLAGLTLGIALRRRGVPVRLVEAAAYPRHRVCGEFISGLSETELAELDCGDIFAKAARPRETAWFEGGREWLRRDLPAAAIGLSRHVLDAGLARRFVELGGGLRCGERFSGDGEGVVWATGRPRQGSGWLGLKAHFEGLELSAVLELHLQNRGYVGLTKVEEGRVNVCGLFRRSEPLKGGGLPAACREAGLPELAEKLENAALIAGSLKGVSNFSLGWQPVPPGRVSVGDAAAMIPPFTGNGMAMAMQSALLVAEPLARWSRGESSWSQTAGVVRREQRIRFGPRLRWARWLHRLLLHRTGRQMARLFLRSGLVRFETLYAKLR